MTADQPAVPPAARSPRSSRSRPRPPRADRAEPGGRAEPADGTGRGGATGRRDRAERGDGSGASRSTSPAPSASRSAAARSSSGSSSRSSGTRSSTSASSASSTKRSPQRSSEPSAKPSAKPTAKSAAKSAAKPSAKSAARPGPREGERAPAGAASARSRRGGEPGPAPTRARRPQTPAERGKSGRGPSRTPGPRPARSGDPSAAAPPGDRVPRPPGPSRPAQANPRGSGGRGGPLGPLRRAHARARRAWDRPLTAYYLLLGSSALITLLGLVMVFSASQIQALRYDLSATYYFRKQVVAAALGAVLLLVAARLPVRLLRMCAYPLLAGALGLLVLVQVPGVGVTVNGSTNWIQVGGPFLLQPSEFGKLALVLWGADLLARKGDKRLLGQWKHLLVPLVPAAFLMFGLIMLGGDMGTVMILTGVLFALLWLAGAPTRLFALVLGAVAVLGALLIATAPHRMDRLACIAATEPGTDDRCWQAVHGIYALASGGWFGSGLGASMEKWGELPEPHTDFIFAITGEELGLAGTLSVLGLFAALGYAGIRVAGRTADPFVRYAAGGVVAWLLCQVTINIGAVLGLLPIAGVPLPLFSYGGSALLPTMFAVGLLIAFARSDPAARAALAVRQPAIRRRLAAVRRKTMRRRVRGRSSGER